MRFLNQAVILLVQAYRYIISPILPPSCRFTPTCSQYTMEAFSRFPFHQASYLSIRRILRCHPYHPGGYDPVPEPKPKQKAK